MNCSDSSSGLAGDPSPTNQLADFCERIRRVMPWAVSGSVTRIAGSTLDVADFPAPLGAACLIFPEDGEPIDAEVVGFRGGETLLCPFSPLVGIRPGNRVELRESIPSVSVGSDLLGRVLDGRGRLVDEGPRAKLTHRVSLSGDVLSPLSRPPIDRVFSTGVRAIDGLLTCGQGQRLGIFSGSGVGKSKLLAQMARGSSADVNVVVLVGERGREVREFIERDLGPEGLARSVVVVATSDEPALVRLRAAFLGTAIAEFFRDQGDQVLLMMDSVTRFALAQRELGLAAGEPPATRGYPASVFSLLPRLLERSGRTSTGSITAFYSVLVEGDDTNEPVADTVRGILDGHIMMDRGLAEQAHWPAIDVVTSISRSFSDVTDATQQEAARTIRGIIAEYHRTRDLISIGAYKPGSNVRVDRMLQFENQLLDFLRQDSRELQPFEETCQQLQNLHRMMLEGGNQVQDADVTGEAA